MLQIRPKYLLLYNILEGLPRRKSMNEQWGITEDQRQKAYSGLISPGSAKNLRRAIENLVAISIPKRATEFKTGRTFKFKVNFITLTLPCPQGKHSDKEVKSKCLDVWIKSAKRRFGLKSYVWRAERQKNGNIHFHLITDCYIHYEQLRDSWNDRLNHLSYIDLFEAKHGHRTPNSTDVHAVSKIRDLSAYMVKYMTKGVKSADKYRAQPPWRNPELTMKHKKGDPQFIRLMSIEEMKINGRVWDCSANLKQKVKCDFVIDTETSILLENAITQHNCRHKSGDVCSIIFTNDKQFQQVVTGRYRLAWEEWLKTIRN